MQHHKNKYNGSQPNGNRDRGKKKVRFMNKKNEIFAMQEKKTTRTNRSLILFNIFYRSMFENFHIWDYKLHILHAIEVFIISFF